MSKKHIFDSWRIGQIVYGRFLIIKIQEIYDMFFLCFLKKYIFFWNIDSFIVFWTNYNTVTLQLSLCIIISHNFDMILLNVALLLLCFAVHTFTLPWYQSKTKHFNLYLTFNLQHLTISLVPNIFPVTFHSLFFSSQFVSIQSKKFFLCKSFYTNSFKIWY